MKKYFLFIFIIILIVIAICYSININNNKTEKINNSVTINDIDNISSVMLKEETEGGYIYYKTENKELIQEIIKALNNIQIGEKVDVMFNDSGRYYIIEYSLLSVKYGKCREICFYIYLVTYILFYKISKGKIIGAS